METPKSETLTVSEDGMTITATADTNQRGCVVATKPFSFGTFDYFEITIESPGEGEKIITMGLTSQDYNRDLHPGWDQNSVAYHGDDGLVFGIGGSEGRWEPYNTAGQVIGCGMDLDNPTGSVFFTKNGALAGFTKCKISGDSYPAIGFAHCAGCVVKVNFGETPFKWEEKNTRKARVLGDVESGAGHAHPMRFEDATVAPSPRVCDSCAKVLTRAWRSTAVTGYDLCNTCFNTKSQQAEKALTDVVSRISDSPSYVCTVTKLEANLTHKLLFVHFEAVGDGSRGAVPRPTGLELKDDTAGKYMSHHSISWKVQEDNRLVGSLIYELSSLKQCHSYSLCYAKGSTAHAYAPTHLFTVDQAFLDSLQLADSNLVPPGTGTVRQSPAGSGTMRFDEGTRGVAKVCDWCGKKERDMWRGDGEQDMCQQCFGKQTFESASMAVAGCTSVNTTNAAYVCTVSRIDVNVTLQRFLVHLEARGDGSAGAVEYPSDLEVKDETGRRYPVMLSRSWKVQDAQRLLSGALIYDLAVLKRGHVYSFAYGRHGTSTRVPLLTLDEATISALNLGAHFGPAEEPAKTEESDASNSCHQCEGGVCKI